MGGCLPPTACGLPPRIFSNRKRTRWPLFSVSKYPAGGGAARAGGGRKAPLAPGSPVPRWGALAAPWAILAEFSHCVFPSPPLIVGLDGAVCHAQPPSPSVLLPAVQIGPQVRAHLFPADFIGRKAFRLPACLWRRRCLSRGAQASGNTNRDVPRDRCLEDERGPHGAPRPSCTAQPRPNKPPSARSAPSGGPAAPCARGPSQGEGGPWRNGISWPRKC